MCWCVLVVHGWFLRSRHNNDDENWEGYGAKYAHTSNEKIQTSRFRKMLQVRLATMAFRGKMVKSRGRSALMQQLDVDGSVLLSLFITIPYSSTNPVNSAIMIIIIIIIDVVPNRSLLSFISR